MTIDWWTLGLQAVNVLILVWLLARFFWKPIADTIAARRDAIAASLAQAEASRIDAAAQQAAIAQTRAGFATEREAVLAAAQADAEKVRAAQLAKAAGEIEALHRAAAAALDKQRQAAEEKWRRDAGALALDIAERLVGRLDGTVLRRAFFDDLLTSLKRLPEAQRRELAAGKLDLIAAWTLTPAEAADFGSALTASLGGMAPRLAADPALIAGFDLRGPHLVVSNSWKADLDRIGEELRHAA